MVDNKNFSNELELSYLCLLIDHEEKDEFMTRFSGKEGVLAQMADQSLDYDVLSKLKKTIEYKKDLSLVGEMIK